MRREVLALREALESAQFDQDQRHARAASAHRSELEELQSMIRSLRELIDSERAEHAQALADLRRTLGTEIRALQNSVVESRAAFEEERLKLQGAHQAEMLVAGRVRIELEATIRQLRERLDAGV